MVTYENAQAENLKKTFSSQKVYKGEAQLTSPLHVFDSSDRVLMTLEDTHGFFKLVDPGAHCQVGTAREEHLWGDEEVQDHPGVSVKALFGVDH